MNRTSNNNTLHGEALYLGTQKRSLITVFCFFLYLLCFYLYLNLTSHTYGVGLFMFLPLSAVALNFGARAGLIMGIISHPLNMLFLSFLGLNFLETFFEPYTLLGWGIAIFVGLYLGKYRDLKRKIAELDKSKIELQERLKRLDSLLPICSACKKVRVEGDSWIRIEDFLQKQADMKFTHTMCPDCEQDFYNK
ncbi:MAG: hypothetical protein ACLFR1_09565 [Spirochaetia bacterium]